MSSKPVSYPTPPSWLANIPGYGGYHAKEQRRQADRALREDLQRRVTSAVQSLQRLSGSLARARRYADLAPIDTLTGRLQHLADRLRTAPEGYRPLFNQERVDEAVLDQLIAFDQSLAAGVERLGTLAGALNERTPSPLLDSPAGQELAELTERLHQRLDARNSVVSDSQPLPSARALEVLNDPPRPGPPPRYIKMSDAVSYAGANYIVDAIVNYSGGRTWTEYRLRDGDVKRWLLAEPGRAALLDPLDDVDAVTFPDETTAAYRGHTYTRQSTGSAQATVAGPTGQQQMATTYRDYHDENGALLVIREWSDERHIYHGEPIDSALIEVYPRA